MTDPHTLWATAQLVPGEGIEDGVARIAALLAEPLDCRTCGHHQPYYNRCAWISATCIDGHLYDPLPPVRLWRDNVRAKRGQTAPQE